MSNQELIQESITLLDGVLHANFYLKKYHPELITELKRRTDFLVDANIDVRARLFCLQHEITSQPICQNPNCQNPVKWHRHEFLKNCCCRCSGNNPKTRQAFKETNLKNLGVEFPAQSIDVIEKMKSTNISKFGVACPLQNQDVNQKSKSSILANFGVEHPMKSNIVKDKFKNTMMDRYGAYYSLQSKEIQSSIRQSILKKYGVEHPTQSEEIMNKLVSTNNKKYGVDFQWQRNEVKQKSVETCLNKYGVDNYSKTFDFHQKSHKPYVNDKYPNLTFSSSWEFLVYDFLSEHHIEFEYQPSISYAYEYNGVQHTYHPDFKVRNKLVEVKGDHFFRINESTGQEEMYCPYRYENWDDERYEYECGKYEAKHQCMINNNVLILRNQNIQNLNIDMFA